MKYIIDRFEEAIAVCEDEDGTMILIQRASLPKEASEGDVVILLNDMYVMDKEKTKKRKTEIEALAKELWND